MKANSTTSEYRRSTNRDRVNRWSLTNQSQPNTSSVSVQITMVGLSESRFAASEKAHGIRITNEYCVLIVSGITVPAESKGVCHVT